MKNTRTARAITITGIACSLMITACGSDPTTTADSVAPTTAPAAPTTARSSAPAAPVTTEAAPSTTPTTVVPSTVEDDAMAAQVEAVLTDAIAPGSIRWDVSGVDIPPTAAVAAVRVPGRDDVLVAVGENVDGSPVVADAPFGVASLAWSLVNAVAFQLIDEGVLDPSLTVDNWAPTLPNADRVTVQMVLDGETGWSDYGPIEPDPVLTDFKRAWTLREAVELRATTITAAAEPGTPSNENLVNETVLGLIVEEVGGRPLAELVRQRVSEPAGLDDTSLLDGSTNPEGFRHGVFFFNGTAPADTSEFEPVSWLTWNLAANSSVSTPTDLLDLLDVWAAGELFTTDRTPAPDRYAPDPAGNPNTRVGRGVPFNAYCPCTDVDGGIEPTAIGRAPGTLGTRTFLLRYADGISVVVNFNSNEAADNADVEAVANAIHDVAARNG